MDPITITTITIALIEEAIKIHSEMKAGKLTPDQAFAQLTALSVNMKSDQATNEASAIAEEKARGAVFPADEKTPTP